jgi:hypothetical protein
MQLPSQDSRSLQEFIERGLLGKNQGLSNGMQTLNRYLYGTHRGRYYLMGAESGVGKTTLGDYMFFYNLYSAAKALGVELQLDYYSFELPLEMKKARLASYLYFLKYHENLPAQYIIGMQSPNLMSEAEQAKMKPVSAEVDDVFSHIWFVDVPRTPSEMWARLVERAEQSGEVIRDKDKAGRSTEIIGYKPNPGNENIFRMTIVDHIALTDLEERRTLKQTMDDASNAFVRARNKFGDSVLIIQQFNTEMQGAARERKSAMAYVPTRSDFGDSKYTFRDADVVMGLTRPVDFQLDAFGAYTELPRWGDYFILNFVMKNRYGMGNTAVPMFMNPIAGIPEELPSKDEWSLSLQQDYIKKAEMLNQVCQLRSPNNE